MDPSEIAILQAQRGQANKIPGREVQIRGLGMATGPVAPVPPPPPPPPGNAGAQSAGLFGIPWWALLGIGAVVVYAMRRQGRD